MIGTTVSHYRIVDKLGAGGMGEVYVAEDELLGRRVAIKFPSPRDETGEFQRRFEREARVASRLTHPQIARIYDYGQAPDGRPFLVMELVPGASLREVLRQGRLEPGRAVLIVGGVLRALREAHTNGLVHRDIKPANVMLGPADEVKVLDFGLAKEMPPANTPSEATHAETQTASLTAPGKVAGTPAYMSPEQARGGIVDARSDLFSTGLLLYYCLTGVAPFSGSNGRELLNMILTTEPLPASTRTPGLGKSWDGLIAKALHKEPAGRYQTAEEMLADLEALDPSRSRSLSKTVTKALAGTRRRATLTGLSFATLAAAAILLVLAGRPHQPPPDAEAVYQRGVIALRDGTYYAARRLLQNAVDLDHNFALAHARLAEAESELDDGVGAGAEMLAALPQGSGSAAPGIDGMYIDAIHLTLERSYSQAAKAYQRLAGKVKGAEKAAVLVDLGRIYEKNSLGNDALAAYRRALTLNPQSAAAHLRAGTLMGRQRKRGYKDELDSAFTIYRTLSNTEGQAEVWFQRGYLLSIDNDVAGARTALEKSREMAQTIPSEPQEIAATLQLSIVAYLAGDVETAKKSAAEGAERAQRANMTYLAARGLANLGDTQFNNKDYDQAAIDYEKSLEVSRRFGLHRAEAKALFGMANFHQIKGPVDSAAKEAAAALDYFGKGGFRVETIQCLILLGRIHRDLGKGEDAAGEFGKASAAAQEISSAPLALQAQLGLASVFLYYGRWAEAIDEYQSARKTAATLNSAGDVVRALSGQAAAAWRLGRYADAENGLEEAGREVEKLKSPAALKTSLLFRKAEMTLSRGKHGEAAAMAQRVSDSPDAAPQTAQNARCMAGLAMARSGKAAAGRKLCEPALAELVAAGDHFAVTDALLDQSEILLALGDDSGALDALGKVVLEAEAVKIPETEWQAWALRARALRHRGDADGGKQAAQKASELLAGLKWDAASLQSYRSRPDISSLERELQGGAR